MLPLSTATLDDLDPAVERPTYDRSAVTTGIVHLGVGGFHRAHQAMYVDRLLSEGGDLDWGICGVGVLESDRAMAEALRAQDCLYTVVEKASDGTVTARVVGSIVAYLFAPDDPLAVVERMADPATRVVSLTITEGGYVVDPASPDLTPDALPRSAFGLVVEALARRRARGLAAFTVLSCDNIAGNGDVARASVTAFARLRDPALGDWVAEHVRFPNSMVDRITPATTPEDAAELGRRFGIRDRWPVVCEPFIQWVLQDDFGAGRPALERVGVQVVADVEPYELMKLRLLNASHQALCYFGYLAGYRLVHEVCLDPLFTDFLLAYMEREATPTLGPVPGVDLDAYRHELITRFSNSHVRDTVVRLCADSSDRIPSWLLPVLRSNLDAGGEVSLSAAVVASWARYAEGVDEQGEPLTVVDPLRDRLMEAACRQRDDPLAFVRDHQLFGRLADDERFVAAYLPVLASLHDRGARGTLQALAARRTITQQPEPAGR